MVRRLSLWQILKAKFLQLLDRSYRDLFASCSTVSTEGFICPCRSSSQLGETIVNLLVRALILILLLPLRTPHQKLSRSSLTLTGVLPYPHSLLLCQVVAVTLTLIEWVLIFQTCYHARSHQIGYWRTSPLSFRIRQKNLRGLWVHVRISAPHISIVQVKITLCIVLLVLFQTWDHQIYLETSLILDWDAVDLPPLKSFWIRSYSRKTVL